MDKHTNERLRQVRDKVVRQYFTHPSVTLIDIGIVDSGVADTGVTDVAQAMDSVVPRESKRKSELGVMSSEDEPSVGIRIHVRDRRYVEERQLRNIFPTAMDGIPVDVLWGDYDAH